MRLHPKLAENIWYQFGSKNSGATFLHILSYFALPCFVYCFLFRPLFHNVLFMILILSPFSLQTWKQFMNSFKSVFKQEKAIENIQALLFKVALNKINIYSFGISIFFDLSALTPVSITFSGVGFSLNVLPMKSGCLVVLMNAHFSHACICIRNFVIVSCILRFWWSVLYTWHICPSCEGDPSSVALLPFLSVKGVFIGSFSSLHSRV